MSFFIWQQTRCFCSAWPAGNERIKTLQFACWIRGKIVLWHPSPMCIFYSALSPSWQHRSVLVTTRPNSPSSEAIRKQLCGRDWQVWILREMQEKWGSHSLSMRGAEIALKMTSCWVMLLCVSSLPRPDGESVTHLPCAVPCHPWVSRS